MMSREYAFMSALMEWFNASGYARQHGKFSWIDSVTVETSGCEEGTCNWEDIVITGDAEDDTEKTVRLSAVSVQEFFRNISTG